MTTKAEEVFGIISDAVESGKSVLNLEESRKLMELSGIPFNKSGLATSEDEAVEMAKEIGYPLVMKIVSPQIIHKTEVGGVRVGIETEKELRRTYKEIITSARKKVPDAEIKGILLEEMVKGTELIVGTTVDPQFGPMIMFGIGGIFVEVYKDVSFRLVPINYGDAKDMLNEIRGKPLLDGIRGLPAADSEQLINILLSISDLVNKNPNIKEMDLNPLIATKKGLMAVDARVILTKPKKVEGKEALKEIVEDIKKLDM